MLGSGTLRCPRQLYIVSFFFFQAEDGIRDHCVTGVQTCALPISLLGRLQRSLASRSRPSIGDGAPRCLSPGRVKVYFGSRDSVGVDREEPGGKPARSEERRVGKEGRSRWSPYH